ncbi:phosphate/phosphite/phosphonate ABC transporter substrate-binding protein [Vibrio ostreicida]|uniref:Phosphate/phosphite/phosphonate ABC transporter substrate-binding protein n=1 Tax=Vibrio ostreicida TaxID=526588 RepID=A0ABT8BT42_9VIBR|nr:phosphate/phosphite/phosphonate ABC transporter substrate-binding protein [Vibrio ostreicida]MDN3609942.1 phosphate/phosphite/phosphonate ABC transporter substrate-binding protein [Vibrio ostreicida]NPD10371.1 phosphate/phosphite/phosphonate ABC transporter substrate-binding protein [Vibrio ostreicida]
MKKLCFLALFISAQVHAQDNEITFGIVPQQSAVTLAKNWGPILKHLSDQTGYNIVFRTAKNIPEFEQRVLNGEYDIAYMNPYHYTVFHQKPGYQAFAKQKDKKIRGIVVAKKDGDITELKQLDGQTVVFPSPAAFAASVVPRSSLKAMGINITPQYVSSHDSVYLNVSKDLFPAGGGIERTLNNTNAAVRDDIKVLWRTPGYTPHAFATHPDMPQEVSDKVANALVSLNNSPQGKDLLVRIKFKGIEPAQNSDWDDVRKLNITLLDKLLQE